MSTLRARTLPVVAAALLALGGCSAADEPETEQPAATAGAGTDQETGTGRTDPAYDGPYDSEFYDAIADYEGEEVTVAGRVQEVVSPTSFTIVGPEDTEVGPLLVVDVGAVGGFEPDMLVAVSGVVGQALDIEEVEERYTTNLDDELHEDWSGGPYLEAVLIDMTDGDE